MSDTTATMTLLEQLAVHAPIEPQPWFQPVVPARPKRDPKLEFCDGCKADSDCDHSRPDCDKLRAYYEADAKWKEQAKVERLLQWPWAWARAVLNARHAGVVVDGNVVTVNRQAVFDHFASEHDLILTESEMVEVAHVVSKDLCDRITNLINENTSFRADSQMLERFVEKINAATPEFESMMGSPCDHAELALGHLIHGLNYYRAALNGTRPDYVPARVELVERVRADTGERYYRADPGEHECDSNEWGAVSVKAVNGKMLGVKPSEFIVTSWRENK